MESDQHGPFRHTAVANGCAFRVTGHTTSCNVSLVADDRAWAQIVPTNDLAGVFRDEALVAAPCTSPAAHHEPIGVDRPCSPDASLRARRDVHDT